jgi:hypothetical protein
MVVVPESGPLGVHMPMGATGSILRHPPVIAAGLPALWTGRRPRRAATTVPG